MRKRIVILGGGPAGYSAAIRCAQLGGEVTVVEKENLGGVCLNRGCIPTKTILQGVILGKEIDRAKDFGWQVKEKKFSWEKLRKKKEEVVGKLRSGLEFLFTRYGIKRIPQEGVPVKGGVRIGEEIVQADALILATGSSPLLPPEFQKNRVLTNREILELEELPTKVLIVGGGVNGCEFAYIFSSLGVRVTLVEMLERILPQEDEDISREVSNILREQGVEIKVGNKVEEIREGREGIGCRIGEEEWEGDYIFACMGRVRNTKGMKEMGIEVGREGVKVNERLETNIPGVYAVGDLTPSLQLAHVAYQEGFVAAENALGGDLTINYRVIPRVVYIYPEVGSVGMTEREAKEKGWDIKTVRLPFTAIGKAYTEGELRGWVKLVVAEDTEEILGIHILSPHASEIIGEGIMAMELEAVVEDIARAIHPHPTRLEALKEAWELFLGRPLHFLK